MSEELTPMFPPSVKPIRVGVYFATNTEGESWYRCWNGEAWLTGGPDVASAAQEAVHNVPTATQSIYWRGLAEKP